MTRSLPIAIVTGGSRGIGRSTVLSLAQRGVSSIITYKSRPDAAEEVVAGVKAAGADAVAVKLDVGDSSTFDAL